uniref:Uncharacterized protein n=1 Tax=Lotharella oceanica TaxID=641309 RepID=A0A7S2X5M4_9EUKA|mmetsp:Transcript_11514/g.22104  ORF Transcript_11514/g.22104 Transcript_11514/m.22104 type:complete len:103 (+) Transcript_11514:121-429(+)
MVAFSNHQRGHHSAPKTAPKEENRHGSFSSSSSFRRVDDEEIAEAGSTCDTPNDPIYQQQARRRGRGNTSSIVRGRGVVLPSQTAEEGRVVGFGVDVVLTLE